MTDVTSVTTMVVINPIGDNLEVGTRAHWDSDTQNLYYVDVLSRPFTGTDLPRESLRKPE
jgi:hypothetical protein